MRTSLTALVFSAAALLAACGGGSDDSSEAAPAPPSQPSAPGGVLPPSATDSIQAFIDFLGRLLPADRDMPLDINAATPPTSETALPQSLD